MKPFTPKALHFVPSINEKTKDFFNTKNDIYQQATERNA
jgi:hypothetical protein